MTIYRSLAEVPADFGPSALTIGNFEACTLATGASCGGCAKWPNKTDGRRRYSLSIRILRAWWRRNARRA